MNDRKQNKEKFLEECFALSPFSYWELSNFENQDPKKTEGIK